MLALAAYIQGNELSKAPTFGKIIRDAAAQRTAASNTRHLAESTQSCYANTVMQG